MFPITVRVSAWTNLQKQLLFTRFLASVAIAITTTVVLHVSTGACIRAQQHPIDVVLCAYIPGNMVMQKVVIA